MADLSIVAVAQYAYYAYTAYTIYKSVTAKPKKIEGSSLDDLRVTGAEYGQVLPWVQGHRRVAGWVAWASAKRKISHTTTEGGKGGGGGTEVTTYTYEVDLWIVLTTNQMAGLSRAWNNGKLCYSNYTGSDAASLEASETTSLWRRLTFYSGASDQLPDPTYEAAVGIDNAVALRGRSSVFLEGLQLDSSGQLPLLNWEVQSRENDPNVDFDDALLPSSTTWGNGFGYFAPTERFIANAGGASAKAYSEDGGATWLSGTGAPANGSGRIASNAISALCGCGGGTVQRTTDGIAWAAIVGPTFGSVGRRGLSLLPNDSFIIIDSFAGVGRCFTSPAGNDWSLQGLPPTGTGSNDIGVINSSETVTVALAGRVGTTSDKGWYSTDNGVTWTAFTAPVSRIWTELIWNGRVFMAFDWGSATCMTSATGLPGSWTVKSMPHNGQWFSAEALLGGAVMANGLDAATVYITEDDGDTWTPHTITSAAWRHIATDGYRWVMTSTSDNNVVYSNGTAQFDMNDETYENVVSRLCLRSGMAAAQFDATALSAITMPVRGFAMSQVEPIRGPLAILAGTGQFEVVVSDKAYFRVRGGSSVVTIPHDDLGASEGDPVEPLALKQRTDIELPAYFAVTYPNVNNDYQPDTQSSDRLITSVSNTVETIQSPIAMTESEAKALADFLALDAQIGLVGTQLSLLGNYARLEPTDPVVATAADGSTFRLRLVKKTDAYPVQGFDAVLDDVSVLSQLGITTADFTPSTVVVALPDTVMEPMDIPIARDVDDDPGFYVTAKGETVPYPGGVIYGSRDDVLFEEKARVTESGVFGTCTTTLGDWTGPRVFDEVNSVTVSLGDGTASSSTRAAVLADLSVNAWLIGSELIQAHTATLVSPGVYKLTGLLRGGRGSEWAMTGHVASERAVRLQMTGLRRVNMETGELGVERFYRGVTFGKRLDSATSEAFTNNAIGLKPFAPSDLRGSRDPGTGDITLTCERRTRLAVRTVGALGVSVPLGEDSEAFDWVIYADGTYAVVKRTLTSSTPSVVYTSAQQTTDFGSNQATVYVRVYQRSAQVGLGYPLERAA